MFAVVSAQIGAVRSLLKAGADERITDISGIDCVQLAERKYGGTGDGTGPAVAGSSATNLPGLPPSSASSSSSSGAATPSLIGQQIQQQQQQQQQQQAGTTGAAAAAAVATAAAFANATGGLASGSGSFAASSSGATTNGTPVGSTRTGPSGSFSSASNTVAAAMNAMIQGSEAMAQQQAGRVILEELWRVTRERAEAADALLAAAAAAALSKAQSDNDGDNEYEADDSGSDFDAAGRSPRYGSARPGMSRSASGSSLRNGGDGPDDDEDQGLTPSLSWARTGLRTVLGDNRGTSVFRYLTDSANIVATRCHDVVDFGSSLFFETKLMNTFTM
jgi:hypothetical protein